MQHFLLLMHTDNAKKTEPKHWEAYFAKLKANGNFGGGSSIGGGLSFKNGVVSESTSHWLAGYMVINANDMNHAKSLVDGNPILIAGGTVELRDLPKD